MNWVIYKSLFKDLDIKYNDYLHVYTENKAV